MPLPLFLGIGAAIAAAGGVGAGIHGGVKMKEANDTMKSAQRRHEDNIAKFEKNNKETTASMDKLGTFELGIIKSFESFTDVIERIQNKPEFKSIERNGIKLPSYSPEELKRTSVGAGVLIGGLGGAAAGTAGGFAAAGATTAAVMALGTASTGTAIASLSGAAATNATLAALGGGALAAGGGGMALGSMVLGGATLGVGLLVGGIIFNFTGSKLSDKADEAWRQMKKAEEEINKICTYLSELKKTSDSYYSSLKKVNDFYEKYLQAIKATVFTYGKTDWYTFTQEEKMSVENCSYLVGLLYNMCKVQLVKQSSSDNEINSINYDDIRMLEDNASKALLTMN